VAITHLGLPTSTYQLSITINLSYILLLQVYHRELMWWLHCVLQWVEDEEVEKTRATFHWTPQPYSSMGRAVHSGGRRLKFSRWTLFWKSILFVYTLIVLLLGITSTHGTWVKLNALHLGTRLWWLLMDICFRSTAFTARWAHWRHRYREKTKNSCGTFLSKPHRQTVVNQLSCRFNSA